MNPFHSSYSIQTELDTDDWTLVRTDQGIQISYAIISVKGEHFLSIRFENTAAQPVDFVWSMTKDGIPLQITADEMTESRVHLQAAATEVIDGSYLIPCATDDNLSDFNLVLQTIKR